MFVRLSSSFLNASISVAITSRSETPKVIIATLDSELCDALHDRGHRIKHGALRGQSRLDSVHILRIRPLSFFCILQARDEICLVGIFARLTICLPLPSFAWSSATLLWPALIARIHFIKLTSRNSHGSINSLESKYQTCAETSV